MKTKYIFLLPLIPLILTGCNSSGGGDIEELRQLGAIPTLSDDGKTLTYGLYPQKNVNDPSLISSLNSLTSPESNGWYLYNKEYYAKVNATPSSNINMFDNRTVIVTGTTYWFKCEPITWNVLSNNNDEYLILSNVLLDAHLYSSSTSIRTIDGKTVYQNNYEYSDIRTWLNNDFYNSSFSLDDSFIQTTSVDNSPITTGFENNPYACNNTQDKVFLLSYQDYINSDYGFETSTGISNRRCCRTTDWARAKGIVYYTGRSYLYDSAYWTRSPYHSNPDYSWTINFDGRFNSFTSSGVCTPGFGVRPALTIKIV